MLILDNGKITLWKMNVLGELLKTTSPKRGENIRIHINDTNKTIVVLMNEIPIILFEFLMKDDKFTQIKIGNIIGGDTTCRMIITYTIENMPNEKICNNINKEITDSITENEAFGTYSNTSWSSNYNINEMCFS